MCEINQNIALQNFEKSSQVKEILDSCLRLTKPPDNEIEIWVGDEECKKILKSLMEKIVSFTNCYDDVFYGGLTLVGFKCVYYITNFDVNKDYNWRDVKSLSEQYKVVVDVPDITFLDKLKEDRALLRRFNIVNIK